MWMRVCGALRLSAIVTRGKRPQRLGTRPVDRSRRAWSAITRAERISDCTRTPRSHGQSKALMPAGSSRSERLAAYTIATSAERPEGAGVVHGRVAYTHLLIESGTRLKGKVGRRQSFK
jgi:hypothetical protein